MINGNPNRFLEVVYSGQDATFIFRGKFFWSQGYTTDIGFYMEISQYEPILDEYIWTCEKETSEECLENFLCANIFDGKTFWEVESEIEWIDD